MMNIMVSIGHSMDGSGLSEALYIVHGQNAMERMMLGKAIFRALSDHFFVSSALATKLVFQMFPCIPYTNLLFLFQRE